MNNIFFNFLKKIDGISFIKPNDEELIKFREISDGLPELIYFRLDFLRLRRLSTVTVYVLT